MKAPTGIATLIKRFMDGDITPQERSILEEWRAQSPANEAFFLSVIEGDDVFEDGLSWIELEQQAGEDWLHKLKKRTSAKIANKAKPRPRWRRLPLMAGAVAAVLLLALTFAYFQLDSPLPQHTDQPQTLSSIKAGTNTATLVLSSGEIIDLRRDTDGIILDRQLTYADGTRVLDNDQLATEKATICVPKGGTYKITLSDGSKVWLNADSKLTYPLLFDQQKRSVSLEGEGYFEVATVMRGAQRVPFEVICKNQKIQVTGTAFNVSAYADDGHTTTTLVEGAVTVETDGQKVQLTPNQQAVSSTIGIQKNEVDVQAFVAWKANKFLFYETELRDVMKAIGRWYAIDIAYEDQIKPTYFYGEIAREKNLAEILRIIGKSGVDFKLKRSGETPELIVMGQEEQ